MKLSTTVQQKTIKAFEEGSVLQIIALILRYGLAVIECIIEHKNSSK